MARSATRAATSSRATAGRTASARASSARVASTWRGTPPRPTRSASHEFADWLEKVGSELMLAVNLGTRGVQEALDLLEYANIACGTDAVRPARRQRARRAASTCACGASATRWTGRGSSGTAPPTTTASSPAQTARAMRMIDPDLELVVCGSSSRGMPTFGDVGAHRARAHATTRSTTSRATRTTRSTTATSAASSRRRSTWTASSRRSSRPPTTVPRPKRQRQEDQHLVRRVERLVPRATTRSTRDQRGSTSGRSRPACSKTSTRSPTRSSFGSLLISLLKHADRVHRGIASPSWST